MSTIVIGENLWLEGNLGLITSLGMEDGLIKSSYKYKYLTLGEKKNRQRLAKFLLVSEAVMI